MTERKIRHIVDIGLALLGHSSTLFRYWHFAFEKIVFIINRMPIKTLSNAIPFQILFHQQPDYNFLKIFGCAIYPLL